MMRRRWIVSIMGMAALFCLTACVGAGPHNSNASTDPQQFSASMNQAFAKVLENSLKKASLGSHASDAGRGVLYDLNGDGRKSSYSIINIRIIASYLKHGLIRMESPSSYPVLGTCPELPVPDFLGSPF